jgi:hypothetical protein
MKQKEVVYWIGHLCWEDSECLVGGHWLSDSHICKCSNRSCWRCIRNKMVSSKHIYRLQWKLQWKSSNVHNHWVCTYICAPGVSDIYGSMVLSHLPTLAREVATITRCPEQNEVYQCANANWSKWLWHLCCSIYNSTGCRQKLSHVFLQMRSHLEFVYREGWNWIRLKKHVHVKIGMHCHVCSFLYSKLGLG